MSESKSEPERQPEPRRSFTEEFKREAVRLARERGNVSAVAQDLGINESVLQRWKKRLQQGQDRPFPGRGNPRDQEMAKLQKELARVKQENEILKRLSVSSRVARSETRECVGGEIPICQATQGAVSCGGTLPGDAGHAQRLLRLAKTPLQ